MSKWSINPNFGGLPQAPITDFRLIQQSNHLMAEARFRKAGAVMSSGHGSTITAAMLAHVRDQLTSSKGKAELDRYQAQLDRAEQRVAEIDTRLSELRAERETPDVKAKDLGSRLVELDGQIAAVAGQRQQALAAVAAVKPLVGHARRVVVDQAHQLAGQNLDGQQNTLIRRRADLLAELAAVAAPILDNLAAAETDLAAINADRAGMVAKVAELLPAGVQAEPEKVVLVA